MTLRFLPAVSVLLCGAAQLRAQEDPKRLAVAESALAHRDYDRAVDLARSYTHDHWNDWRGWYLQGEASLSRTCADNTCRVQAIIAFRHATQLAPERLDVWDGYGSAGLELAGADGEVIIHEAYEKILAVDPFWPDAWERWLLPWRDQSIRERMRRILAKHDSIPEIRARIAQLIIEDERYADANLILDPLVALDSTNPRWLALRAQSAFEDGDTATGVAYYARAIARADRDGAQTLYQQAVGIATPNEIRQWEAGIPAAQRPGWLRSFWARRDPNLFAGINQRVAEHFARLREARRQFRSTFPLSGYKNRSGQRAMAAQPSAAEQLFYQRCEAREFPRGPTRAADRARMYGDEPAPPGTAGAASFSLVVPLYDPFIKAWTDGMPGVSVPGAMPAPSHEVSVPYTRDLRDVDTTAAAMGYNLRTGLDDRGITYLRFGAPRKRVIGSTNNVDPLCQIPDLERWVYDDIGTVRFFRPEAVNAGARSGWGSTGELVFRPLQDRQFEAMEIALTKNATSVPAVLSFGVWTAQLADSNAGWTDLVVVTTRGAAAAQLASAAEAGPTLRDTTGIVILGARPGRYALNANALLDDALGRQSLQLTLRSLGSAPGMSDLVLAPAWADTAVTREGMLRHVRRDLVFSDATLRVYSEVYGLRHGADGHVRYRASYQIYPTQRLAEDAQEEELEGGTRLTFDRVRTSAGGPVVEWLDITPEQLPAGRYLLRLEIMEPRRLEVIGRAQIGFDIRPRREE